jgi:hypothetical protein
MVFAPEGNDQPRDMGEGFERGPTSEPNAYGYLAPQPELTL